MTLKNMAQKRSVYGNTLFCTLDEDIIPVKPVEADISLLIREGGVETTKIPHGHMKALDEFVRG